MTDIICITGYEGDTNCDHCGRGLIHGIQTSKGTLGSDCIVKMVKADRRRFNGNGKPSSAWVRQLGKGARRPGAMGLAPHHFQFELAN